MPYSGSFQHSDLTRPWPRRRAALWILVCVVLVVGLLASVAGDGDWMLLGLAIFPAFEAVRTARRLQQACSG